MWDYILKRNRRLVMVITVVVEKDLGDFRGSINYHFNRIVGSKGDKETTKYRSSLNKTDTGIYNLLFYQREVYDWMRPLKKGSRLLQRIRGEGDIPLIISKLPLEELVIDWLEAYYPGEKLGI